MILLDQIRHLTTGQEVTVHCLTTNRDVFYCGGDEDQKATGRQRVTPQPLQLQPIPYTISGQVTGLRESNGRQWLVVRIIGEGVVMREVSNYDGSVIIVKVAGTERRAKECQIPLSAIERIETAQYKRFKAQRDELRGLHMSSN